MNLSDTDLNRINQDDILYGQITLLQAAMLKDQLHDNKIMTQITPKEKPDFDRYLAMSASEREQELNRLTRLYTHKVPA